jgi:hypothetical protein
MSGLARIRKERSKHERQGLRRSAAPHREQALRFAIATVRPIIRPTGLAFEERMKDRISASVRETPSLVNGLLMGHDFL